MDLVESLQGFPSDNRLEFSGNLQKFQAQNVIFFWNLTLKISFGMERHFLSIFGTDMLSDKKVMILFVCMI